MKKYLALLLVFFLFQCENTSEPENDPLDFSKMEISYLKYGGWIQTSVLNIDSMGYAEAFLIAHASDSVMEYTDTYLSEDQKVKFEKLFASFSEFKSYYQPPKYYTDGDDYRIVLIYKTIPDTVRVYEPENSILPRDLEILLNELHKTWENLIYIHASNP